MPHADLLRRALTVLALTGVPAALAGCPAAASHDAHGHEGSAHGDHGHDEQGEHGAHTDEVTLAPEALSAAGIRVDAARTHVLRPTFTVPARAALDTDATAHVGVQFSGRVRELLVRRGDRVAKGDVLLVVESPEFGREQIEFLAARDALAQTEPPIELAQRLLQRARDVFEESRSLPLSAVEERERALQEAESARAAASAAASAAENRLHVLGMTQEEVAALAASREVRTQVAVRAPIPGEVIEREVTLGESVGPERDALLVLADPQWIWVLAEVPEARLADVHGGGAAVVRRPGAAAPLEGVVRWIEPLVDASSRTARVRVVLPREGSGLLPGMFAEVEFAVAGADPAPVVAVPAAAVQTVEGGPAVFVPVADEPGTFAKRAVRVGPAVGGLVPVLSGLAEGEDVVVDGAFVLKADLGKSSAAHEH